MLKALFLGDILHAFDLLMKMIIQFFSIKNVLMKMLFYSRVLLTLFLFFLTGISTEMLHVLENFLQEDSTMKVNFIQSFLT